MSYRLQQHHHTLLSQGSNSIVWVRSSQLHCHQSAGATTAVAAAVMVEIVVTVAAAATDAC